MPSYGRVSNDGRPRHMRCDLFKQFQPFRADAVFVYGKTRDVAARPRQAFNEAGADWIGRLREQNRYRAGRL